MVTRVMAIAASLLALSFGAAAQTLPATKDAPPPKFKDYPVKTIYRGKPARLRLTGDNKRYYYTYYNEAAGKGVTFAGRYAIVTRTCGSTCVIPDILDLKTGKALDIPLSISGWREYHDAFEPIEVKADSRLIVFLGARNEQLPLGYHYYVLENGRLTFLRTIENDGNFMEPLPKE